MKLESRWLDEVAAETGFRAEVLEKVVRLGDLAGDIARHPLLGRVLLLKGGTALNLGFGPPQRLSVDLDFNYVGALDRAEMLRERPKVEEAVESLAVRKGYEIQRSADEHAGRKHFLGYRSAGGSLDRIEVDLNYLFREPLGEPQTVELWQPSETQRPPIRAVGKAELAAGKVCALLDRVAPRDLFDVALLPSLVGESWDTPRFRQLIVAFSAILEHPLYRYGRDRLDRVTESAIRDQLQPMLSSRARVASGELKSRAWAALEPLLALSPEEAEYVRLVQEGVLRPELLFGDDPEPCSRLARSPALRWKILNAQKRSGT